MYACTCTHTHTDSAVILVESTHLQIVKNLIWRVRVQWRALAGALGVSHDTVEEIRHDLQCRNDGDRLEVVLTEWMRGGTATVHDLLTALSHHTVNGGHVSRQLRALQGEARQVLGLCETESQVKLPPTVIGELASKVLTCLCVCMLRCECQFLHVCDNWSL